MALWSRKRDKAEATSERAAEAPAESVPLDGEDHAWWAQAEVEDVWRPRERKPLPDPKPERDILAEHFGEDWRTSLLDTGPTDEELEQARVHEQQALEDQDPYKVLQVDESATWDEIVAAHRHQARSHHPDRLFGQSDEERAEGEERIRVINQAYQELRIRRGK